MALPWLDILIGRALRYLGAEITLRSKLNFGTGFTVTDDPANDQTTITATAGGGGTGATIVTDQAALKALAVGSHVDGQQFTVKATNKTWTWSAATGAGFEGDDRTTTRPTAILVANPGRYYLNDGAPIVPTIAALRLAVAGKHDTVSVQAYSTLNDGGGGTFDYDSADTITADNGGTIIVAGTRRYKRRCAPKTVNVKWFGAKGDDTTDDTTAIQNAIAAAGQGGLVDVPKGTYKITSPLVFADANRGVTIRGTSADVQNPDLPFDTAAIFKAYLTNPFGSAASITTLSADPDGSGVLDVMTVTGLTSLSTVSAGDTIELSGTANPNNAGVFTILSVNSGAGSLTCYNNNFDTSNASLATAPDGNKAAQVWQVDADAGPAFSDQTTDFNDAGAGDWVVFPATDAVGDYAAIGLSFPFNKLILTSVGGTQGVGGVVVWEYWNGSAWTALSGVTDGTTSFTAALGAGQTVSWTVPGDWAAQVLNGSASLYYVRARITTTYTTNPAYSQGVLGGNNGSIVWKCRPPMVKLYAQCCAFERITLAGEFTAGTVVNATFGGSGLINTAEIFRDCLIFGAPYHVTIGDYGPNATYPNNCEFYAFDHCYFYEAKGICRASIYIPNRFGQQKHHKFNRCAWNAGGTDAVLERCVHAYSGSWSWTDCSPNAVLRSVFTIHSATDTIHIRNTNAEHVNRLVEAFADYGHYLPWPFTISGGRFDWNLSIAPVASKVSRIVSNTTGTSHLITTEYAHGLVADQPVRFLSKNTIPAGLVAGTTYYVLSAGLTPTAFRVSATVGGAGVNVTGTGTGLNYVCAPDGKFIKWPLGGSLVVEDCNFSWGSGVIGPGFDDMSIAVPDVGRNYLSAIVKNCLFPTADAKPIFTRSNGVGTPSSAVLSLGNISSADNGATSIGRPDGIIYTQVGEASTTPKAFQLPSFAMPARTWTLANGNNDNVADPAYSTLVVSGPSAAFAIRGIVGGTDGRILEIYNPLAQQMTIAHDNAGSTAANRLFSPTGADVVIPASGFARLKYSTATSRWIVLETGPTIASGASAGGDLASTYPNPTVKALTGTAGNVAVHSNAKIVWDTTNQTIDGAGDGVLTIKLDADKYFVYKQGTQDIWKFGRDAAGSHTIDLGAGTGFFGIIRCAGTSQSMILQATDTKYDRAIAQVWQSANGATDFGKINSTGLYVGTGAVALTIPERLTIDGSMQFQTGAGKYINAVTDLQLKVNAVTRIKIDGSGIGFYGATPTAQQADVGALTDNTTGTADGTVADVGAAFSQATLNNNFADLVAKINGIRTVLRNLGLTA